MEVAEARPRSLVAEKLPPLVSPYIRSALASLSFNEFREEFAIPTPVDRRNLVDYEALMYQVSSFVEPNYRWKAPFFDEHHLYWKASYYDSALQRDPALAGEFRDIAANKIWVPREFHNFVHLMTLPPDVPSYTAMRDVVKDYRRKNYLYRITSQIVNLREVADRMRPLQLLDENGSPYTLYVDPVTKRSTNDIDKFEQRRQTFIHQVETHHRRGYLDLAQLTSLTFEDAQEVADVMPIVRDELRADIHRSVGRAAIRVDIPYEKVA